jgi:type I restriction enzyme S subunit
MAALKRAQMNELCELVTDGTHDSPKIQTAGIPFIKGKNISGGTVDFSKCDFITLKDHEEACRRVKPQRGDILFSNIGSVGDTAVVNDDREFSIKNVALFRPDQQKVDPAYFYYLVLSPEFRSKVMNVRSGSAQPFISLANLRSFEISYVEDGVVQRRIAGILSAYDELIENSQRRIKILESMARALYREWFVHFRFPGHESVPRVPSPLGEIPQGWEVKSVANAFEILGGGTPSRKEDKYWEGGDIQWFSPSDLTGAGTMFMDDSSDHITRLGLAESSACLFPAMSVMLTSRATIGAIAINTRDACTNQGFITCRPNDRVPLYYLFHWATENVPTFQRMASGATFKEISRGVFKTIDFLQPPTCLTERFEAVIVPMAGQVLALQRQIQNLRRTRDLLLPRLLSGQIDVEALDHA